MAFCSHCGAQNRDGARFCESCGQLMGQAAGTTPGQATPPPTYQKASQVGEALSNLGGEPKTMVLIGIGLYIVAAALALMGGSMLDLIISAAIAAGVYIGAYLPLSKGDLKSAAGGATVAGGVALLFGFLALFSGNMVAAIWNFAAGAALGLAAMSIKKRG